MPPVAVGTLAIASGEVREKAGWLSGWRAMDEGDVVLAGRTLETGPDGRAALAVPGGVSVRVDRGTRVAVVEPGVLMLVRGALYVDSGAGQARLAQLRIETTAGSVRHVGTQYELRLLDSGVRLRVREGRVEFRSPDGAWNRAEAVSSQRGRPRLRRNGVGDAEQRRQGSIELAEQRHEEVLQLTPAQA